MIMHPLVRYYIHQAGRGKNNCIGPVYEAPPFLHRATGSAVFLQGYCARLDHLPEWCQDPWARDVAHRRRYFDRHCRIARREVS